MGISNSGAALERKRKMNGCVFRKDLLNLNSIKSGRFRLINVSEYETGETKRIHHWEISKKTMGKFLAVAFSSFIWIKEPIVLFMT